VFVYKEKSYECSFELGLSMFSRKWNSLVLYHLSDGTKRHSELKRLISGVTQKMLTQTLRDLERFQLIHRKVYPVVPPKVEYSLTQYGKNILPILEMINTFGEEMFKAYDTNGLIEESKH
jgi:DNA-binding HxlR family transcriptional regulator